MYNTLENSKKNYPNIIQDSCCCGEALTCRWNQKMVLHLKKIIEKWFSSAVSAMLWCSGLLSTLCFLGASNANHFAMICIKFVFYAVMLWLALNTTIIFNEIWKKSLKNDFHQLFLPCCDALACCRLCVFLALLMQIILQWFASSLSSMLWCSGLLLTRPFASTSNF